MRVPSSNIALPILILFACVRHHPRVSLRFANGRRYTDMHELVEIVKKKHVQLDDRSMYVLKRAGQRMRKQRRAQAEDR